MPAVSKRKPREPKAGAFRAPRPDRLIAKWGRHLSAPVKVGITAGAVLGFFVFVWFFGSIVGPTLVFAPLVYFTWNTGSKITAGEARWLVTFASVGAYFLLCKVVAAGLLFVVMLGVLGFTWAPPLWERRGGGGYAEVFSLEGGFRFYVPGSQARRERLRRHVRVCGVLLLLLPPLLPTASAGMVWGEGTTAEEERTFQRKQMAAEVAEILGRGIRADLATSRTDYYQAAQPPLAPAPPAVPPPNPHASPTLNNQLANKLETLNPLSGGLLTPLVNLLRNPPGLVQLAQTIPSQTPAPTLVEQLKNLFVPPESYVVTDPKGHQHLTQGAPPASPLVQGTKELIRHTAATFSISLPPVIPPENPVDGSLINIFFTSSVPVKEVVGEIITQCGRQDGVVEKTSRTTWTLQYTVDCRKTVTFKLSATTETGQTQSVQGAFEIPHHAPEIREVFLDLPVEHRKEGDVHIIPEHSGEIRLQVGVASPDATPETVHKNVDGILIGGDLKCETPDEVCGWPLVGPTTPIALPEFPAGEYTLRVMAVGRYGSYSEPKLFRFRVETETRMSVDSASFHQLTGRKDVTFTASYVCQPEALIRFDVHWGHTGRESYGDRDVVLPCPTTRVTTEVMTKAYAAPGTYYVSVQATMLSLDRDVLFEPFLVRSTEAPYSFFTLRVVEPTSMPTPTSSPGSGSASSTSPPPSSEAATTPPSEPGQSSTTENVTAKAKDILNEAKDQATTLGTYLTSGTMGYLTLFLIVGAGSMAAFWFARKYGLLARFGIHPKAPHPPEFMSPQGGGGWLKRLFRRGRSAAQTPLLPPRPNITFNLGAAQGRREEPDIPPELFDADDLDDSPPGSRGAFRAGAKRRGK